MCSMDVDLYVFSTCSLWTECVLYRFRKIYVSLWKYKLIYIILLMSRLGISNKAVRFFFSCRWSAVFLQPCCRALVGSFLFFVFSRVFWSAFSQFFFALFPHFFLLFSPLHFHLILVPCSSLLSRAVLFNLIFWLFSLPFFLPSPACHSPHLFWPTSPTQHTHARVRARARTHTHTHIQP